MTTAWDEDEWAAQAEVATKPLSKQEAAALIEAKPQMRIRQILAVQVGVGLLLATFLALLVGKSAAASSVYGVIVVLLPASLFARGIKGRFASQSAMNSALAFFLWEGLKLVLTVILLALAVKIAGNMGFALQWPYLLLGMVATMKAVWLAEWWHRRGLRDAARSS